MFLPFIVNSYRVSDAFLGQLMEGLIMVCGLRRGNNVGWNGLLIDRLLIEIKVYFYMVNNLVRSIWFLKLVVFPLS